MLNIQLYRHQVLNSTIFLIIMVELMAFIKLIFSQSNYKLVILHNLYKSNQNMVFILCFVINNCKYHRDYHF